MGVAMNRAARAGSPLCGNARHPTARSPKPPGTPSSVSSRRSSSLSNSQIHPQNRLVPSASAVVKTSNESRSSCAAATERPRGELPQHTEVEDSGRVVPSAADAKREMAGSAPCGRSTRSPKLLPPLACSAPTATDAPCQCSQPALPMLLSVAAAGAGDDDADDAASLFSLQSQESIPPPSAQDGARVPVFPSPRPASGDGARPPPMLTPVQSSFGALPACSSAAPLRATPKPASVASSALPPLMPGRERTMQVVLNEALLNTSFDARSTDDLASRARLAERLRSHMQECGFPVARDIAPEDTSPPLNRAGENAAAQLMSPRRTTPIAPLQPASPPSPPAMLSTDPRVLQVVPTLNPGAGDGAMSSSDNPLDMPMDKIHVPAAAEHPAPLTPPPASSNANTNRARSEAAADAFAQSVLQHLNDIKAVRKSVVPRYFRDVIRLSGSDSSLSGRSHTSNGESISSSCRWRVVSFNEFECHLGDGATVSSPALSEGTRSARPSPPLATTSPSELPPLSSEQNVQPSVSPSHSESSALTSGVVRTSDDKCKRPCFCGLPASDTRATDAVSLEQPAQACRPLLQTLAHPTSRPPKSILVLRRTLTPAKPVSPPPLPPPTGSPGARRASNFGRGISPPRAVKELRTQSHGSMVVQVPASVDAFNHSSFATDGGAPKAEFVDAMRRDTSPVVGNEEEDDCGVPESESVPPSADGAATPPATRAILLPPSQRGVEIGSGVCYKAITPATVPHKMQLAKRAGEDYLLFTQMRPGFLTSFAGLEEDGEVGSTWPLQ